LRWSSGGNKSSFSEISDFSEESAMIHLRNRTGAVGHRNCGLTDSYTRGVSLSLALQVNYAPAAEEVKAVQGDVPGGRFALLGSVARRQSRSAAVAAEAVATEPSPRGLIWPCISRDVRRARAGAKRARQRAYGSQLTANGRLVTGFAIAERYSHQFPQPGIGWQSRRVQPGAPAP
jgi:hypothetical protein